MTPAGRRPVTPNLSLNARPACLQGSAVGIMDGFTTSRRPTGVQLDAIDVSRRVTACFATYCGLGLMPANMGVVCLGAKIFWGIKVLRMTC